MLSTRELEVKLLDYGPKMGKYSPDCIVSASGLLTAKYEALEKILSGADESFLTKFHREATRRGHASLLTTPYLWFWIKGSRFVDFYLSSMPFGSFIIFSSRRIRITPKIAVIPEKIEKKGKVREVYAKAVKKMIEVYQELLKMGFSVDEARRALPLGFFSQGLYSFSLQTLLGVWWEAKKNDYLPRELKLLADKLIDIAEKKAPIMVRNAKEMEFETHYPQRHPFKAPERMEFTGSKILVKEIELKKPKNYGEWKELAELAKTRLIAKLEIELSVSAWNDIKRHRTAIQEVESIYSAAERKRFYIPPGIKRNERAREIYEEAVNVGFEAYENLKEEIGNEAMYALPHALLLRTRLILNGYHFLDPFGLFGVRLCTTADPELRSRLRNALRELGDEELEKLVGPKCKLGFCPEKNFCAEILKYNKRYTKAIHLSKYSRSPATGS